MSQDFSLSQPKVFQCQNCREFINTSMSNCSYCGVEVNLETATAAADVQSKVAKACSDASFLKVAARALAVFFLASMIPIVGGIAGWGFVILLIAVPIMLIGWWLQHKGLQTADADYEAAKRDTVISAVIWCGVVVVWLAAGVIQAFLLAQR